VESILVCYEMLGKWKKGVGNWVFKCYEDKLNV